MENFPLDDNYGSNKNSNIQDNWLTSYGDLMTILLVFFVLLISASKISSVKFEKIKNAFNGPNKEEFSIAKIHDTLVDKIEEEQLADMVEVVEEDDSLAVIMKNKLLFASGSTRIREENIPIVSEILKIFKELPHYANIAIEGYTDDNPVNTKQYRSNWHLSVLRSLSVLELINKHEVCQDNCQLRGFGEFRPQAPNRDEQGNAIADNQSQNRRVVIRVF